MTSSEMRALSDGLVPVMRDYIVRGIAEQTAELRAKNAALETRLLELETQPPSAGKPGPPGRDGVDGKDGTPGLNGKDGRDGVDGKDGAPGLNGKDGRDGTDGKDGIPGMNGKDGAHGLNGKDGQDGLNGKDAPPVDVEALVERVKALIPIPKDGADGAPGLAGKDGRDGMDGAAGARGEKGDPGDPIMLDSLTQELKSVSDRLVNIEGKTLLAQRLETDLALAVRRLDGIEKHTKQQKTADEIPPPELTAAFLEALTAAMAESSTWQPGS